MHTGEDILAHEALGEHDGVLIVVSLPRHVGHKQVASQRQFTVLSSIALGEDLSGMHVLPFLTDRSQVDGHVLVGAAELGYAVLLEGGFEAYELLLLGTVVEDTDGGGIDILDYALTFGHHHGA